MANNQKHPPHWRTHFGGTRQRRRAVLSRRRRPFPPALRLRIAGEDWTVQDLGSKNGTFVNNIPLKAQADPESRRPHHRRPPCHRLAPEQPPPRQGVVVFEGGEPDSPTTSTVVTSLEGALSNQTMAVERGGAKTSAPMQALIRAGQELSANRPLDELFPVILDLAIQAVNAQRGVLLIARRRKPGCRKAHKGEGFRISTARARPRAQGEILHPGARRAARRRLQGPHEHRGAEGPHHDGGAAANQGPHHRPDLRGFAVRAARIHQGRSEPADRDGERGRHPHRKRAPGRNRSSRAHHAARSLAGRRDPGLHAARATLRRSPGADLAGFNVRLPHGGRRLLRFLPLRRWPCGAGAGRCFRQGHAGVADDDGRCTRACRCWPKSPATWAPS